MKSDLVPARRHGQQRREAEAADHVVGRRQGPAVDGLWLWGAHRCRSGARIARSRHWVIDAVPGGPPTLLRFARRRRAATES